MKQHTGNYLQILERNRLDDGTELLHVNEIPPPYSTLNFDDWEEIIVELQPQLGKFGFTIAGGIDTTDGRPIFISHIEHCSNTSKDNGRSQLRLFDQIRSVNGIDLSSVTHDDASDAFSRLRGTSISLHLRRLDPKSIDQIEFILPTCRSNEPLGLALKGGSDKNSNDPGLFVDWIDPDGLLASIIESNRIRAGDRLLEIKTNHTSANLRHVSRLKATQLIRRICQDHERITLTISHRTVANKR